MGKKYLLKSFRDIQLSVFDCQAVGFFVPCRLGQLKYNTPLSDMQVNNDLLGGGKNCGNPCRTRERGKVVNIQTD